MEEPRTGPEEIKITAAGGCLDFSLNCLIFIRTAFFLTVSRKVLRADDAIFVDPKQPIDARPEVVRQRATNMQWQISSARKVLSMQEPYEIIEKMMIRGFRFHDDSISLQAYRPTTYFCHAVALWDFLPRRTVGMARRSIWCLRRAMEMARALEAQNVCVYSFTRTYGEMMPAGEYALQMEKSIRMIESRAGKNLSRKDDRYVIEPDPKFSSLLMTLNF